MKTLRVTLADIIGPTGTPNSTATVHARYVDTSGRGRDVHLNDGTIVVPVRRSVAPGTGPERFDFAVYANDVAPVREVDYGHLVEVSWTVVAPTGAKTSGVRRVAITDDMPSVVQLGLLSTPTPVPPYTGGYVLPGELDALDGRVVVLEAGGGGGGAPTWTDVTGKPSTFPPDTEATQDIIGAMVAGAGGTYNDAAGTITLPGGFDPVQFSIGYNATEVATTLAASSFVTVTYGPATPSTNVGGGTFDTGTGIYTVPATGRYLILARVRAEDNMPARSVGVGVHGSNADGPYFVWRTTGAPRDVLTYQRVDSFTAGTQLRTFIYSEGGTYPLIAAALTIDRIG